MNPFRPSPASTTRITAVGTSAIAGLPHGGGTQVRVRNRGVVEAYVEFGSSTVTASVPGAGAGSMGLPAGGVELFTLQQTERHVAVAVESGTPSLEITVGLGE